VKRFVAIDDWKYHQPMMLKVQIHVTNARNAPAIMKIFIDDEEILDGT